MVKRIRLFGLINLLLRIIAFSLPISLAALVIFVSIVASRIDFPSLRQAILAYLFEFFVLIFIAAIVLHFDYQVFTKGSSKAPDKLRKNPKTLKVSYEMKCEIKKIIDSAMTILLVLWFVLTGFVNQGPTNLFSNPVLLFLFVYVTLFAWSFHGLLSAWTRKLDGIIFWLDRFLKDFEGRSLFDSVQPIDSLGRAARIFSSNSPRGTYINVKEFCNGFEDSLFVRTKETNRKVLKEFEDIRHTLSRGDKDGAWRKLRQLAVSFSRSSGIVKDTVGHKIPLKERITSLLKSKEFVFSMFAIVTGLATGVLQNIVESTI